MENKEHVAIAYDQEADTMYFSFQDVESEAEEIDSGVFARYSHKDKSLAGFTIINFSKKFGSVTKDIEIPLRH